MKTVTKFFYYQFAALVLAFLALSPTVRALNPPPDGCYPGFTTAEGCDALNSLTTGAGNTGVGWRSLFLNTTASFNTGIGVGALVLNNADSNTAVGAAALLLNIGGTENTAIGVAALLNNDSSGNGLRNHNTAVGAGALANNVDGSENTVVGTGAGSNLITGFNNTYIGDFVGILAPDENSIIRIGDLSNGNGAGSLACFIGGIFNNFQPLGGTVVEVTLDLANDKLGWDIGPNQGSNIPVQRGTPLTDLRPQHQAMLDGKVRKLEATIAHQQKQIETLIGQLREQAAQIQKVSAQIEVNKAAPQTVLNNP